MFLARFCVPMFATEMVWLPKQLWQDAEKRKEDNVVWQNRERKKEGGTHNAGLGSMRQHKGRRSCSRTRRLMSHVRPGLGLIT